MFRLNGATELTEDIEILLSDQSLPALCKLVKFVQRLAPVNPANLIVQKVTHFRAHSFDRECPLDDKAGQLAR